MRRPSPALVLAAIAVLGAWGGPAIAAKLVSSRDVRDNSLTSRDIKDRSLTGRDVKSNSLTGRVIGGLSGRDIIEDGIDGSDVDERTLEAVGSARRADSADSATRADTATRADSATTLNGVRVQRMNYARAVNADTTTVVDLGGLALRARCTGAGALAVTATTETTGFIRVSTTDKPADTATTNYGEDDDFRAGETFDVLPGANDDTTGALTYVAADGGVVTATFLAEGGVPPNRGFACLFAGTATYAPAG